MAPRRILLTLVALVGALLPAAAGRAAEGVPQGWTVVAREAVEPGTEHLVLRRTDPAQEVHVARLAPGSGPRLVPVLAGGRLGALEGTSTMCARVGCVVAVNGDFWDPGARPVGAMVAAGELVTTPALDHVHLVAGGSARPTLRHGFEWTAAASTLDGLRVPVRAVNRPLDGAGATLYTARWGAGTGTPAGTTEVTLEFLLPSPSALPAGTTAVRVSPARGGGNSALGPNQVVLAATGASGAELAAFAARAAVPLLGGLGSLSVELGGAQTVLGGSPLLLDDGRVAYPADNPDSFTQDRHARTVVGLTAAGEVLLVTVDANATSAGMSLREVTELMAGLGAVEAMNLDGGGSTTFVTGGAVRNSPPNGERPVVSALALVPRQGDLLAALLGSLFGGGS